MIDWYTLVEKAKNLGYRYNTSPVIRNGDCQEQLYNDKYIFSKDGYVSEIRQGNNNLYDEYEPYKDMLNYDEMLKLMEKDS